MEDIAHIGTGSESLVSDETNQPSTPHLIYNSLFRLGNIGGVRSAYNPLKSQIVEFFYSLSGRNQCQYRIFLKL